MTQPLQFDASLLARYDVRGPRYTSYPTAPQFGPALDEAAYRALAAAAGTQGGPLSLYVHIPFCRTVCFYCACNKVITANYRRAEDYLGRLEREIALQAALLGHREVTQLHLGGGTPTYLNEAELRRLMAALNGHFRLSREEAREFSIEIDPRTVDPAKIALLGSLGFNRMSLGVQDFDPVVQQAVNRIQSVEQTAAALEAGRRHGFASTNIDLIYGLPRQTLTGLGRTLDTVLALRPERLAIYSYAHLPSLFKVQNQIDAAELPSPAAKLDLLALAIERLTGAGYRYIGMDHFALPEDALSLAQERGTLQRNFQGYSTQAECDLIGLGASAIGRLGASYAQNVKDLEAYAERLDAGRLAVFQGVHLSADDRLRRDLIQGLMCQGRVDVPAIEARHGIAFSSYFARELERLAPLADDGLVTRRPEALEVTARGRLLLRNLAMTFDAYLPPSATSSRYSQAI